MIRPATFTDHTAIFGIAIDMTANYPNVRPDEGKINRCIQTAVSSSKHFAMVSEKDGKIVGALLAITSNNLWAQRSNCQIILWATRAPGEGIKLLREFRGWAQLRRVIRLWGVVPDFDVDPRVLLLLERTGFKRYGGSYQMFRELTS